MVIPGINKVSKRKGRNNKVLGVIDKVKSPKLKFKSEGKARLNLSKTYNEMMIYGENKIIEFFKKEDNEPNINFINTTVDPKYDTIDTVNIIVDVEENGSKECVECGGESTSKMFDMDGTNLEEISTCNDCGFGTPNLIYIKQ